MIRYVFNNPISSKLLPKVSIVPPIGKEDIAVETHLVGEFPLKPPESVT